MRTFLTFVAGLATAAILAALVLLALENGQGEQVTFLGATVMGTVGLDIAAGAGLGFVAALLVLLPGQASSAARTATLGRKLKALEGQLAPLREEKAKLAVDYARLQEEHRCLREEMARLGGVALAVVAATPPPRTPERAAKEPADDRDVRVACAGAPVVLSRCACAASRAEVAGTAGGARPPSIETAAEPAQHAGAATEPTAAGGAKTTSDKTVKHMDEPVAAKTDEQSGEAGGTRTWWARVRARFGGEAAEAGESAEGERKGAKEAQTAAAPGGVTMTTWRRAGGAWQA